MMGLKQMVDVRGGIAKFSIALQLKLHRSVSRVHHIWGEVDIYQFRSLGSNGTPVSSILWRK